MYDKFTVRAQGVMRSANAMAQKMNREYIGTQDILLGLLMDEHGVAKTALTAKGVTLDSVMAKIGPTNPMEKIPSPQGLLPHSSDVKMVVEYAIQEAQKMGDDYVGTEHLLLGLLRKEDGVACLILKNLGVGPDDLQKEIMLILESTPSSPADDSRKVVHLRVKCFLIGSEGQGVEAMDRFLSQIPAGNLIGEPRDFTLSGSSILFLVFYLEQES